MSKNCNHCRYAVMRDYGYSDWTVEGTYFSCALNMHPEGKFDRWYGEDPRLEFAENCERYSYGDPLWMSVSGEEK